MKTKEIDFDEDIDFSEQAFNHRFSRIRRDELPAVVRNLRKVSSRDIKSRITIYLDADIILKFKDLAEKHDTGYQTLINNALRTIIDGDKEESEKQNLKDELLKDKKFLRKLKTALSA